jgi:hypothetical protein
MTANPNYIICHASRYDADFNPYTVAIKRVTTRTQAETWMRANCPSDGDCTANEYAWDEEAFAYFPEFVSHFNQYDDTIEWWS